MITRGFAVGRGLTLVLVLASSVVRADPTVAPLRPDLAALKPVDLMPADPGKAFVFDDQSPPDQRATLAVDQQIDGKPVFRVDVRVGSRYGYAVQTHWKLPALKKGSVYLARFAARAVKAKQESGEGDLTFVVQKAAAPWDKTASISLSPGPEWHTYDVPFTASRDFAAGEAGAFFGTGRLQQTLDITGLEILDFGGRVRLNQLPFVTFTYAGREAGAAWRVEALKRIEAVRTASIRVRVTDAAGQPVAGAAVKIDMTRSDFLWGSEINSDFVMAESPDAKRYRETFTEFFNTGTIGNGLKWGSWLNPQRRKNAVATVDWLNARDVRVRGHNLVWPGWQFTPASVVKDPDRDAKLAGLVEAHVRDEATALRGKLICWDVVNEPVHETDFFKVLPRESIAKWYRIVREVDPAAKLVLNEYGMLNGAESPTMIENFLELLRFLRAHDAPIDTLGVQGHVGALPRAPTAVLSDLDLLAKAGLPIQITEFDMTTADEALQADYTRDFLIAVYSHPATEGFVMWGFYQPQHWKPAAAMFRADWSEKPNAKAYRDLVLGEWKTRIAAGTSAAGTVDGRGHHGRYHVTATLGDRAAAADVDLAKDGATVELKLK